jgi:hypothetical protein
MKQIFLLIFIAFFSLNCGNFSTKAQIRATSNGQVGNNNQNNQTTSKTPVKTDITKFDFKNFTYPDLFDGNAEKSFTLKNGRFGDAKQSGSHVYTLRKTYYFDLTGDENDEAITHILVEGCGEGCDSHSLFYIHTVEDQQPKLIWKMATGSEALGGLKSAAFKNKEIVLESFGNCIIQDALITANYDQKIPRNIIPTAYTRFVFSLTENAFTQTSKDILPLLDKDIAGYRAQISFGEQE